jgi:hypothetical protein
MLLHFDGPRTLFLGPAGLGELVPTVQRVGPRPYLLSEWAKNVYCGKTEPVSVKGLCFAFCLQDLVCLPCNARPNGGQDLSFGGMDV